jgi:hypothetical protein
MLSEKRKKNQPGNKFGNTDPYEYNIRRTLIFYCSHINRSSGIFHRSKFYVNSDIFFDEGIKISNSKEELKVVLSKISQQFRSNLKHIKQEYFNAFEKHLEQMVINVRRVFHLRLYKSKKRCYFECMLKNLCPMPSNYKTLRFKTYAVIKSNRDSC